MFATSDHDRPWPSPSVTSACAGSSACSDPLGGPKRTRTSRSWCSATRCASSSANSMRASPTALWIGQSSPPSRGCCRDDAGAPRVAWSAASNTSRQTPLRGLGKIPRAQRRRPTLNAFRAIEVLLPNTFASLSASAWSALSTPTVTSERPSSDRVPYRQASPSASTLPPRTHASPEQPPVRCVGKSALARPRKRNFHI